MSSKIEILASIFIEQDKGYAGAYGMARAMAGLMFEKLSAEDQKFFEGILDSMILDNTHKG